MTGDRGAGPAHGAAGPAYGSLGPGYDGGPMLTGPLRPGVDPLVPGGQDEPEDERRARRTVTAEWALWGKSARDLEYRVLRCSKGVFGAADFYDIITRYTPGAKETLPQYTVCWMPDGEGYLAVAIHEAADADPRNSGGRVQAARGREIEYIRLFCVPYGEMARQQVGYAELVESVMSHQLTDGPSDPVTVELVEAEAQAQALPAPFDALAGNVATLLLTTRPVCVLGAERASAMARLRFIDQVMSLLPYGLRSTMSASTWASATARNLKLRLFFASAERDDDGATSYVTWGAPVRLDFRAPDSAHLRHYANWLERAGAVSAADLLDQTEPVRFDADEIRRMIAVLPRDRPVGDVLEELADGLRHRRQEVVREDVKQLRKRVGKPRTAEEAAGYRRYLRHHNLLRDHPGMHPKTVASVYRVLLDLAYGPVIGYGGYCHIEDCLGAPPRGALAREMLKFDYGDYFSWLLARKAAGGHTDQQLVQMVRARGIAATSPITDFRRHIMALRPEDRPALCDFAVQYLLDCAADPAAELASRGYLVDTLAAVFPGDAPGNVTEQRVRLTHMLFRVYGRSLTEAESSELLADPRLPHTRAFDEAVAELTDKQPLFARLRKHVTSSKVDPRDLALVAGTLVILALVAVILVQRFL